MGVELGLLNQGSLSQPMVHEDVPNGTRNNDSDNIKTHFNIIFMISLKRHTSSTLIYVFFFLF
jgi:hypothetical protein